MTEHAKGPLAGIKVLDVTAIVLANLCVAYIMTSNNEKAESRARRAVRDIQ